MMRFGQVTAIVLFALVSVTASAEDQPQRLRTWLAYSPQSHDEFSTRMGELLRIELAKLPRIALESNETQQNSVPIKVELISIYDGRAPAPPRIAGVFYTAIITLRDPRTGEYVSWDARIGFSGDDPAGIVNDLARWIDNKTEPAARTLEYWSKTPCVLTKGG